MSASIAGRDPADCVGAPEHVRGVDGARRRAPRPGASPSCVAGERADERQALAERAPGVEVGRERDRRPGVDERPRRAASAGRGRARRREAARRRRRSRASAATPSGPVASRWSTERAPSSIASGIAPASVNWSPWRRRARPGSAARLEVAARLRRVERAPLEEDVGRLGDLRRLGQHLREREVEVGVRVVELGRDGVRAEPGRHAARVRDRARASASSVSRSSP